MVDTTQLTFSRDLFTFLLGAARASSEELSTVASMWVHGLTIPGWDDGIF